MVRSIVRLADRVRTLGRFGLKAGAPREVEGRFSLIGRERGKIVPGTRREGKNVWTLTGREYLAQSQATIVGAWTGRNDKVTYIGFGSGSQPEVASVDRLAAPVQWDGAQYLKSIAIFGAVDFPSDPITSVAYILEFEEDEISVGGINVVLREAGLFTAEKWNGVALVPIVPADPAEPPVAYKSFEPLTKTIQFRIEVRWEIRFR